MSNEDFSPLQGFDPLQDFAFDDGLEGEADPGTLDDGPYGLPVGANAPKLSSDAFDKAERAEERISTLFERMVPHTRVLMAIMDLAQQPVAPREVNDQITELQQHHHSVYAPSTFCDLLDRAGAICQTNEEGVPLKDIEREPDVVTVDGEDFWMVAPPPEVFWTLTDEGRAYFDAYQPLEQIRTLFADEPHYAHLYRHVLEQTALDGGATVGQLDPFILADEAAQNPKRYATYFMDKLERTGAVDWQGSWVATAAGRDYLADFTDESEE
ncbi:hypothetical protein [Parvibacter caecicola]|uniref:hypothetical protein n=1 Tax=Parvibacter caecicola TaxID=747645 RepID=UPI00249A1F28|nr:hypothetical protein [Parvibacter caecicola]